MGARESRDSRHMTQGEDDQHTPDRRRQFVIRPNSSLSERGNLIFYVIMVLVSFGIAIPIAAMGYWVVLPFAGFEMLALGLALYLSSNNARRCEVILIDGEQVTVLAGRHRPQYRTDLNRHWTRVLLLEPRARGHRTHLVLRSHGKDVEIGAFLNNRERGQLARALRRAVAA